MGTWEGGIVALPWVGSVDCTTDRLMARQVPHLDAVGELGQVLDDLPVLGWLHLQQLLDDYHGLGHHQLCRTEPHCTIGPKRPTLPWQVLQAAAACIGTGTHHRGWTAAGPAR